MSKIINCFKWFFISIGLLLIAIGLVYASYILLIIGAIIVIAFSWFLPILVVFGILLLIVLCIIQENETIIDQKGPKSDE